LLNFVRATLPFPSYAALDVGDGHFSRAVLMPAVLQGKQCVPHDRSRLTLYISSEVRTVQPRRNAVGARIKNREVSGERIAAPAGISERKSAATVAAGLCHP
jgi:hypothetical protein